MQPPRESRGVFETADLHLASFLLCRGFSIQEIRTQNDRSLFAFKDSM